MARPRQAWLALLLLALAPSSPVRAQFNPNRQQKELIAQKNAISNWKEFAAANNISGWLDDWARPTSPDPCEWTGVKCSDYDQSIIGLNLACSYGGAPFCNVRAVGSLAPELANISTLVELSLAGQNLTGALPAVWGAPNAFAGLRTLSISTNKLKGTLPPTWGAAGAWPSLETINFWQNELTGVLPPVWGTAGAFPKLRELDVSENFNLAGSLPDAWAGNGSLPSIQKLTLSFTSIKGTLPASWANPGAFRKLMEINLNFNTFSGTLPDVWGNATAFPALTRLALSGLGLTGPLPPQWGLRGGFQQLVQLGLDSNLFEGKIPAAWASAKAFPKLQGLNVDNNTNLCGEVPEKLYPAVCEAPPPSGSTCFTGRYLTPCIADFPPASPEDVNRLLAFKDSIVNWDEFAASRNYTGWETDVPVCEWSGVSCVGSEAISMVDISCPFTSKDYENDVPLQHEDPPFVGDLYGVQACTVKAQGTLPPELAGISTLQGLMLYNLNLSGTLPEAWGAKGAFLNLTALDFSANELSGTLPPGWGDEGAFPVIQVINFSRNKFSGTLPVQWANTTQRPPSFAGMQNIILNKNALTGTIPFEWGAPGAFPQLNGITLGNNSMTGTLPNWGGNTSLPKMTSMDLNNLNLKGTLPDSWAQPGSFPVLYRLDLNNNFLSGTLPESWGSKNASLQQLNYVQFNNNNFSGSLPASWALNKSLAQLATLEMMENGLTGTFPQSWYTKGALPGLVTLALNENPGLYGPVPPALLPAVCGNASYTKCVNGSLALGRPLSPPPPSPVPSPEPVSTSSTTNIGAIVGGVVGGLVVLLLLGFFALRPRKGWLRRKVPETKAEPEVGIPPHVHSAGSGDGTGSSPYSKERAWEEQEEDAKISKLVPQVDPNLLSLLPPSTEDATQSALPYSYITTAGLAGRQDRAAQPGSTSSPATAPTPQTVSQHSLETDPVLTFISTRLATLQRQRMTRTISGTGSATSSALALTGRSGSSAASLPPEVRQWAVSWDAIRLERLIGKGSYGRVYLGMWNATPVAVKVLINPDGSEPSHSDLELPPDISKQLQEEAVVMSRMRHPNVVSFMAVSLLPPCILTEYCDKGSLYDVLRQASRDPLAAAELTWQRRLSIAFDAARGLLYLHMRSPPIIHHDVKSPNLLVDRSWNVKVCDFNLSEILRHQGAHGAPEEGATNPIWLAPEVLNGQRASAASDVYSYGLVLYELLTWQLPWKMIHPYQIRRSVLEGERPPIPPISSLPGPDTATFDQLQDFIQLMRDCWAQDPRSRPTFADVVARLQLMMDPSRLGSSNLDQQSSGTLPSSS